MPHWLDMTEGSRTATMPDQTPLSNNEYGNSIYARLGDALAAARAWCNATGLKPSAKPNTARGQNLYLRQVHADASQATAHARARATTLAIERVCPDLFQQEETHE